MFDRKDWIILGIILGIVFSIVLTITSYNLYTSSKNRELYQQCMELTERMLKENKNFSTPYCRI